eukprot:scaffold139221_cov35-Tisochrysis_lutea.AAC.8
MIRATCNLRKEEECVCERGDRTIRLQKARGGCGRNAARVHELNEKIARAKSEPSEEPDSSLVEEQNRARLVWGAMTARAMV